MTIDIFARRNGMPVWVLATLLLSLLAPASRAEDYAGELAATVKRHERGAPDAAHELEIVENLARLSEKTDAGWLPDFWAAYVLTQISMSHSEDRAEHLDRAQVHLDRARERASRDSGSPAADLHALQSLIYGFQAGIGKDEETRSRLNGRKEDALRRAYETDPESPVVMVMAATDLIRDGQKDRDWPRVMGGLALLHEADARFSAAKAPLGLTTHYNNEWIVPWRSWVYRMIEGGFDAD